MPHVEPSVIAKFLLHLTQNFSRRVSAARLTPTFAQGLAGTDSHP